MNKIDKKSENIIAKLLEEDEEDPYLNQFDNINENYVSGNSND